MFVQRLFWIAQLLVTLFGVEVRESHPSDYPPISFTCPSLPPLSRPARNVYELRPQDIKVVMAMGDSITAGIEWLIIYSGSYMAEL